VSVSFYRTVTYGAISVAQLIGQVATPAPGIPSSGTNQNLRVYTYTAPTVAASSLMAAVAPGTPNAIFAIGVDNKGHAILLGEAPVTAILP